MNKEKILGIEKTKKLFDTVYGLSDELIKDLKDKNLSFPEIIALTDNVFDVISSISNISKIGAELQDIDNAEVKELYEHIVNYGFMPEQVTEILSHVVAAAEIEVQVYNDHVKPIIEIIKEMRKKEL